jgi:hypothetical protein
MRTGPLGLSVSVGYPKMKFEFLQYNMRRIITIFLLLNFSFNPLFADAEETVSIRFSALSLGEGLRSWNFDDSTGSHEISIPNASRSREMRYTGPPQFVFYTTGTAEDGSAIKIPQASVDLSGKEGTWLFVLFPSRQGEPAFRLFPIVDGTGDFPANSWRVFNLTPFRMAIKVGDDDPALINASDFRTFIADQQENKTERVQVAISREDSWDLIYRSLWGRRANARILIFLLPADGGDRIVVRRFNQTVRD